MHTDQSGFVIASVQPQSASGWIDAMAVHPQAQRAGAGTALLAQAEDWLIDHGARTIRLGGSLRPFLPGLPKDEAPGAAYDFFIARAYSGNDIDYDVARDLADYEAPPLALPHVQIRPASTELDIEALREFFARAFPGRWQFEFEEFVREHGDLADYIVLIDTAADPRGWIEAFCQTTTARSVRALGRFYMHGLPQPWGQAGPLGVSAERRGQGYAAAVIHAALADLKRRGVRGCVIDWTSLLDFYAKFGFTPRCAYHRLKKVML